MQEIIDFSQFVEIKLEKARTIKLLPSPKSKENTRQVLTAFRPSKKLPLANCSETIEVHAKLSPEEARVIANIYTDIINVNMPNASEPILLEIYKLNTIPIPVIIKEVHVKSNPFIKKIFVFFKISPFNLYEGLFLICI